MYTHDPIFGKIVDFDWLRPRMREVYDHIYPEFNLLGSMHMISTLGQNDPNVAIAAGASMLAYTFLPAAEEYELAASLKDYIFTLGWTEEHSGSDLLSLKTQATPMSDAPDERQFYLKGNKWLINNSMHADYHIVVAKVDPTQDGPRSLSMFLVPRSSTHNWKRLETHVLSNMMLGSFDIDGPGTLLGKVGHGLSIIQRMAMPSKYQCAYVGVEMLRDALVPTIEHLSSKRIFGTNPVNFSNVFRQLYNLSIQAALMDFIIHRAIVFNVGSFLQFHGTMLKSFLLLRVNELLSQTLLVVGSKGFLKSTIIGRNVMDSFVLPVFDGHYTINTLMSAKHAQRYVSATQRVNLDERVDRLRDELLVETRHDEINASTSEIRKPEFFDYADYVEQFKLPFDLRPRQLIAHIQTLLSEITQQELTSDPEYRYKIGDLVHWMESIVAACELWKLTSENEYLNVIIQQYNGLVKTVNNVIVEGNLATALLTPLRQLVLPHVDDPRSFLLKLMDIRMQFERVGLR